MDRTARRWPDSSASRISSAAGEPPGSRVENTLRPARASRLARMPAWVDLPEPSPPSNVMNLPVSPASRCMPLRATSSQPKASTSNEFEPAHGEVALVDIVAGIKRDVVGRLRLGWR